MSFLNETYAKLNPRLQALVDKMPQGEQRVKLTLWLAKSSYNSGTQTITFEHSYPIKNGLVLDWLKSCPGLFDGFVLDYK